MEGHFENVTTITSDVSESITYCGEGWGDFWRPYNAIDKEARLFVTTIGIITNVLNIIVFTRKSMSVSPINKILAGLSVADFLACLRTAFELSVHFYRENYGHGQEPDSYAGIREELVQEIFYDVSANTYKDPK